MAVLSSPISGCSLECRSRRAQPSRESLGLRCALHGVHVHSDEEHCGCGREGVQERCDCGCRSPDSWPCTDHAQISLFHSPTPPKCSTRAIMALINNLGIVYHQYCSSSVWWCQRQRGHRGVSGGVRGSSSANSCSGIVAVVAAPKTAAAPSVAAASWRWWRRQKQRRCQQWQQHHGGGGGDRGSGGASSDIGIVVGGSSQQNGNKSRGGNRGSGCDGSNGSNSGRGGGCTASAAVSWQRWRRQTRWQRGQRQQQWRRRQRQRRQ